MKRIAAFYPEASTPLTNVLTPLLDTDHFTVHHRLTDPTAYDAVLICGDFELKRDWIEPLQHELIPIAVIGSAVQALANLSQDALTLAGPIHSPGHHDIEDCPVDEYISDREFRVLSHRGFFSGEDPAKLKDGLSKLLYELVELA